MEAPDNDRLSIPNWAKADRPRERMMAQGPKALSDAELVAVLIRAGTPNSSALDLARSILHAVGNDLHRLALTSAAELMKINGVGEAKALSILAALELGARRRMLEPAERERVAGSADAYQVMRAHLEDLSHEEFWLLLLDRGLRVLDRCRVSQGGMHGTVADPKVIFRMALERKASAVILFHNHPSGQLRPSEEDIALTRKLREAGSVLDIQVSDHIIVAGTGYYSFADNGAM
ncbi:MAG TPA: DNA repair protein RadC [Flavobacteriales bacterium]